MSTPKTKVLVVQDFFASLNAIVYILKQTGLHGIETTKNGDSALTKLKNGDYGIIVSDWHMKGMDGLSLLKTVREDPELKDIIFIMVTAENDRDKVMEAKESGVDGYVMKPFTAESLCKRLVSALKSRYPDMYKEAQKEPARGIQSKPVKKQARIFGAAAADIGTATPQNWSISLSHFSTKKQPVVKDNLSATMRMLSHQFDMMKADPGFVSIGDMLGKVETTMANTEKQAENAGIIADTTNDINRAIEAVRSAPKGSLEFEKGMSEINKSADELSTMIDSFDKEVEDVISMLSSMEHMVHQAHIHEINESIRASCDLEMGKGETEADDSQDISAKVAGKLSTIQAGSETARETLTKAAGGISNVIEQISNLDHPGRPSIELFQKLRGRIDHIMDSLDNQISLASSLVTGVEDVSSVKQEVTETVVPKIPEHAVTVLPPVAPETRVTVGHHKPMGAKSAYIKLIKNRILMIDMIRKDHMLCIENLEDYLNTPSASELKPEQLPGSPSSSLSKWIDRRLEQQDFHDPEVCRRIGLLRDDMYTHANQAVKLSFSGKKEEALKSYQKANFSSEQIKKLLSVLQDDLMKQA